MPWRPLLSTGSLRVWFPGLIGTLRRSDFLPSFLGGSLTRPRLFGRHVGGGAEDDPVLDQGDHAVESSIRCDEWGGVDLREYTGVGRATSMDHKP